MRLEHVGKFEFPMEEVLLVCNFANDGEAWEVAAELVDIHFVFQAIGILQSSDLELFRSVEVLLLE